MTYYFKPEYSCSHFNLLHDYKESRITSQFIRKTINSYFETVL